LQVENIIKCFNAVKFSTHGAIVTKCRPIA